MLHGACGAGNLAGITLYNQPVLEFVERRLCAPRQMHGCRVLGVQGPGSGGVPAGHAAQLLLLALGPARLGPPCAVPRPAQSSCLAPAGRAAQLRML